MEPSIAEINKQRLENWGNLLTEHNSTPALLIGIGHGERAGEVHVLIPDDSKLDDHAVMRALLRRVLKHLGG